MVVNCPTLSEELLASELFGHAKGAFTGAVRDQAGRVEAAEGGTLFLDEIGELPPALQAKLLRFLQDKQFERVGENRTRHADVRIVAATNRDLDADVKAGRFREDLLYRLNTFEMTVPRAARAARGPRGAGAPLPRRSSRARPPAPGSRSDARARAPRARRCSRYAWPGNVRELRNAIERAVILCAGDAHRPEALARAHRRRRAATRRMSAATSRSRQIEREHMQRVLERAPTLEDAARILGIDSSTLWRKRKKLEEG